MDTQRLLTATLRNAPWGATVTHILAAALDAVEPAAAVQRQLKRHGKGDTTLMVGSQAYDLRGYERVFIIGAGKASVPMSRAAAEILGGYLTKGIVITKDEGTSLPPRFLASSLPRFVAAPLHSFAARHPVPDERGVDATQRVAHLLEYTTEKDLVLVLLSGGGSALLTLPAPGVSLGDIQQLTTTLLACGASVDEINCLRKHLDLIKGGGMARMAAPATVVTLIMSDVVGNSLDVIASGPTVPDTTTFADAYGVLERYGLLGGAPPPVVERLRAGMYGEVADTPKQGDEVFERTQYLLVGSNQQAAMAAVRATRAAGLDTLLLTTYAQGEARVVGRMLAAIGRELATTGCTGGVGETLLRRPACLIMGGETTVTLRGGGHGGRNQELALAAVRDLAGLENVALVTLATDGGDGPTDAAGAVVTGETLQRSQALGLDPLAALGNNDSYPFFAMLDDLLRPGSTETNVNDLAFFFAW